MARTAFFLGLALLVVGCDSNGADVEPEPTTYRVRYLIDGDVVVARDIVYLDAAADTVSTGPANVPFRETVVMNPGQRASLTVDAEAFNPWQPDHRKLVTVIATILVNDVLVVSDTVQGMRPDEFLFTVDTVMPQ